MSKLCARIPASFFGMLLGLIGLGVAWREAVLVWGTPVWIAEAIMAVAVLIWLVLLALYVGKLLMAREAIVAEWTHPVQSAFVALIPITTMLVSIAAAPHAPALGNGLFMIGAFLALVFVVWHSGSIWRSDRSFEATTPILYIPTVAGGLVLAITAATYGHLDLARLCFGIGMFGWVSLESIIMRRPIEQAPLPPILRPALGIQFGPPTVACVAYLAITTGPPDLFAQALLGYGALQALILVRLIPWIREQPFTPAYWGFSFGAAAISVAALRCVERGVSGPIEWLALPLFGLATLVIAGLSLATIRFFLGGRL